MGSVICEFIFKPGQPGGAGADGDGLERAWEHVMQMEGLFITPFIQKNA